MEPEGVGGVSKVWVESWSCGKVLQGSVAEGVSEKEQVNPDSGLKSVVVDIRDRVDWGFEPRVLWGLHQISKTTDDTNIDL